MERYTSADLSRQLRDAGLAPGNHGWKWLWIEGYDRNPSLQDTFSRITPAGRVLEFARALDLHDCLDELTKEREGGPLMTEAVLDYRSRLTGEQWQVKAQGPPEAGPTVKRHGEALVEVAATVLLQLLRARKEAQR